MRLRGRFGTKTTARHVRAFLRPLTTPEKRTAMTDQIPLPPPDHIENVQGFVHDTERRYYSEETMLAHAERLHAARVSSQATQLLASLQTEIDALRHQLQTLAELGNASGDAQILRMGYAAARLEIEHLNTQLQAAREEIKRRDAQEEAIGAIRPLPWRWYSVDKDGLATLCLDREDAEKAAAEANADWPRTGPHRAVRLVEASFDAADSKKGE